jgi:hypothetical protein
MLIKTIMLAAVTLKVGLFLHWKMLSSKEEPVAFILPLEDKFTIARFLCTEPLPRRLVEVGTRHHFNLAERGLRISLSRHVLSPPKSV